MRINHFLQIGLLTRTKFMLLKDALAIKQAALNRRKSVTIDLLPQVFNLLQKGKEMMNVFLLNSFSHPLDSKLAKKFSKFKRGLKQQMFLC